MPSKFELLRSGHAVEVEPGVSGKLNLQNRTLKLSNGEVLNVGDDPDFFPADENALSVSRQKEQIEKGIKGPVGEFFNQYSNQGVVGGAKDWVSYLSQTGQEYANRKRAENEVSSRISEESPYISGAATGANIATDFALTRGMSGLKAAPLLTLGSAGSRVATEPQEVLGETLTAAGLGYGLDKVGGYLNRVAQRRAQSRALPTQQEAVRKSNIAGEQQQNILKQNVKTVNEARLKQHQDDLNARQNKIIKDQNDFEAQKLKRDADIVRLKNQYELDKTQRNANVAQSEAQYKAAKQAAEQQDILMQKQFKLDQESYQKALKELPELQKRAQAEFSENVVKNAQKIEKAFPKSSKIAGSELNISSFIDENLNKSGLAGSREAAQARRVLTSIFPEEEILTGRELSKRYRALEDAIQRSTPEVQSVLSNFKNHLGERLPVILENSIAYQKIAPLLKRTLENDVKLVINDLSLTPKTKTIVEKLAQSNTKNLLRSDLTPANFIEKIQSGELSREMANKVMTVEDFLGDLTSSNKKFMMKQGTLPILMQEAEKQHAYFVSELTKKIQARLARYELKALESARQSGQKIKGDFKKTYGTAQPVSPPVAPTPPQSPIPPAAPSPIPPVTPPPLPPPVTPPRTPPIPPKPQLTPEPPPFIAQAEPTLPQAQGFAQRTGDLLEKNILGGGQGLIDNPLTKLAGLKYLLGNAALPAEAAYLGLNALTSPTAGGQVARLTFKQAGIRAIETWAQKYPSYHDGILENPQDRRSLTKEIEEASDIPIEQKAVLQSKVNRGKALQERL